MTGSFRCGPSSIAKRPGVWVSLVKGAWAGSLSGAAIFGVIVTGNDAGSTTVYGSRETFSSQRPGVNGLATAVTPSICGSGAESVK